MRVVAEYLWIFLWLAIAGVVLAVSWSAHLIWKAIFNVLEGFFWIFWTGMDYVGEVIDGLDNIFNFLE